MSQLLEVTKQIDEKLKTLLKTINKQSANKRKPTWFDSPNRGEDNWGNADSPGPTIKQESVSD